MMIRKYNQRGLVSIMVASVLMVIMSLITLGFTRIVQNEQRQSLDNQLSKQAFYAAESGINMAASIDGFPGDGKDECDVEDTDYPELNGGIITPGVEDVVFTCILINPTPEDLVFGNDSIIPNKSKVVPIKTDSYPSEITFQWKGSSSVSIGEADCSDVANLDFDVDDATWGKTGLLKLDLVGIPSASPFNRNSLLSSQFSAILYPCESGGKSSVTYNFGTGASNVGKIIPVTCDTTSGVDYPCQLTITSVIGLQKEFYARFNSIYSEINVRITAVDASNKQVAFSNAQAVVDSTGRANDVFHRLQARIPLYDSYNWPIASLQTQDDVCKLYEVRETEVVDNCN